MLAVCLRVDFVGNQATVDTCACKQCHRLPRVEASWSSARVRGRVPTPLQRMEADVGEGARGGDGGGGQWLAIKADRWDRQRGSGTHPACQQPPAPFRLHLLHIYKLRVGPRTPVLGLFATRTLKSPRRPSRTFLTVPLSDKGERTPWVLTDVAVTCSESRSQLRLSGFHKQAQLCESRRAL